MIYGWALHEEEEPMELDNELPRPIYVQFPGATYVPCSPLVLLHHGASQVRTGLKAKDVSHGLTAKDVKDTLVQYDTKNVFS